MGLAILVALPAAAAECPPRGLDAGPVKIRLDTGIAQPSWRNDRSRRHLSALGGGAGLKHFRQSGLTQSRTEWRIAPSYQWASYADGRACVVLTGIEASWRVVEIAVDIAREYPPGTCQHQVVRDHEAEHVAIARAAYRDWVPKVEARLKEEARAVKPSVVRDPDAAAQRTTARLMKSVQAVLDSYQKDLIARQAVIDTPDQYRAESAKCPNW